MKEGRRRGGIKGIGKGRNERKGGRGRSRVGGRKGGRGRGMVECMKKEEEEERRKGR